MKKIMAAILSLAIVFLLNGCGKADKPADMSNVKIDYGTSSVYSKEDMDDAIDAIKEHFSQLDGCVLHSLSYTSDEECNNDEKIAWLNEIENSNDNEEAFTQCIAFNSSFHSPLKGDASWNLDEEYTWSWWLGRSDGGKWKLVDWGY